MQPTSILFSTTAEYDMQLANDFVSRVKDHFASEADQQTYKAFLKVLHGVREDKVGNVSDSSGFDILHLILLSMFEIYSYYFLRGAWRLL